MYGPRRFSRRWEMGNRRIEYDATSDLYQQMLFEAQKLEDKRLAKMIARRMTASRRTKETPGAEFGNIIFFPLAPTLCLQAEPEIPFYKKGQFWQDLLQFMFVLALGQVWFVFFMSLLGMPNGM